MRLLNTVLLLTFGLFCLSCTQAGPPSTTFFQPAGINADSRMKSLERQIGYLRSKLGLATYEFEFATPKDKKLIAIFKAELNGSVVPELSGIYHLPPTGSDPTNPGLISVNFFYPQYQTQTPQSPIWELHFSSGGVAHAWTITSPFLLPARQARSTSSGSSGLSKLEDDQEHEVWDYRISPVVETNKSVESSFKYSLKIKVEKVGQGENMEEIRRDDLK